MVAIHRIVTGREATHKCALCEDTRYLDNHRPCPECCVCPWCGGLLNAPHAEKQCACGQRLPRLSADYHDQEQEDLDMELLDEGFDEDDLDDLDEFLDDEEDDFDE